MKILFASFFTIILFISCTNSAVSQTPETSNSKELKTAYFASGCFWCVEAIYESIEGVTEVTSGYSGGHTKNPTYKSSNTGNTGHAEAVSVTYNPKIISFSSLVDVYFISQNPTQINGQDHDIGSQYRSILFYNNSIEKDIIIAKKEALGIQLKSKIAAEVQQFVFFWKAEDYHQNYVKLHPNQPYVKGVSIPRLNEFKRNCPSYIKLKK